MLLLNKQVRFPGASMSAVIVKIVQGWQQVIIEYPDEQQIIVDPIELEFV